MRNTIPLNSKVIGLYRDFLENPKKHGFDYKPLKEVFKETDKYIFRKINSTRKKYLDYIKKPLPKVIFYIIMRETFEEFGGCETDEDGNRMNWGYKLDLNI